MSGVEVITVLGLISSVIQIIETSRDLYDAATSVKGLHKAFSAVSNNIPLVLNILRDCKRAQEQADRSWRESTDTTYKRKLEESVRAVRPIMAACEDNAKQLNAIFEKVVPGESATRLDRYRKAAHAVMPNKKRKVEDLMRDILEKLQLLHTKHFYESAFQERSHQVEGAIQNLSQLSSSQPDHSNLDSHYGSPIMNVNAGTGTQRNYNQVGGSNNRQFLTEYTALW